MPSRANIAAYHADYSPCTNSTSPICYNTAVSGQNIITSLWFNTAVGALCYLLFVYFRAHFRNYDVRVHARSISLRPPALDLRGARRFYSWLLPALRIKDEDLVKSAGLDALVAVRSLGFGLMLLVPVCVVSVGVVLPVNYLGDYFGRGVAEAEAGAAGSPPPSFDPDSLSTTFVKLTMSNVAPGSKLMWVHFVMVIVCVLWGCWLISEYYKEYISLRQAYMIQATEVSLAQGVTQQPLQSWADEQGDDPVRETGPEEAAQEPSAAALVSSFYAPISPKFRPLAPASPFAPLAQGAQIPGRLRAVGEDEVLSQASLPAFDASLAASPLDSPPAGPLQRQPTPFPPAQRQPPPFAYPALAGSRAGRAPAPASPLAPLAASRHTGSSAVLTALGGAESAADAVRKIRRHRRFASGGSWEGSWADEVEAGLGGEGEEERAPSPALPPASPASSSSPSPGKLTEPQPWDLRARWWCESEEDDEAYYRAPYRGRGPEPGGAEDADPGPRVLRSRMSLTVRGGVALDAGAQPSPAAAASSPRHAPRRTTLVASAAQYTVLVMDASAEKFRLRQLGVFDGRRRGAAALRRRWRAAKRLAGRALRWGRGCGEEEGGEGSTGAPGAAPPSPTAPRRAQQPRKLRSSKSLLSDSDSRDSLSDLSEGDEADWERQLPRADRPSPGAALARSSFRARSLALGARSAAEHLVRRSQLSALLAVRQTAVQAANGSSPSPGSPPTGALPLSALCAVSRRNLLLREASALASLDGERSLRLSTALSRGSDLERPAVRPLEQASAWGGLLWSSQLGGLVRGAAAWRGPGGRAKLGGAGSAAAEELGGEPGRDGPLGEGLRRVRQEASQGGSELKERNGLKERGEAAEKSEIKERNESASARSPSSDPILVSPPAPSLTDSTRTSWRCGWLQRLLQSGREAEERKRDAQWASFHRRVLVASEMFEELFGEDFDSIVPIYPTRPIDRQLHRWDRTQARLERALWHLRDLQRRAKAVKGEIEARRLEGKGIEDLEAGQDSPLNPALKTAPFSNPSPSTLSPTDASFKPLRRAGPPTSELSGSSPKLAIERPTTGSMSSMERYVQDRSALAAQCAEEVALETGKEDEKERGKSLWACCSFAPTPPSVEDLRRRLERLDLRATKRSRQAQALAERSAGEQRAVFQAQDKVLEDLPATCFFATFRSQEAAVVASQVNLNPITQRLFTVLPAPRPDDVNWPALQRNWVERNLRPLLVLPAIVGVMLLPIGVFTGAFTQLTIALCGNPNAVDSSLASDNAWFCSDSVLSRFIRNIATSVLPSLVLSLYNAIVLPFVVYYIAQAEGGAVSLSALDRRCAEIFFYWDVFCIFLGAMLGGTVLGELKLFITHPNEIWTALGSAIPNASNFFINYVMFRALVMAPFRLFFPDFSIFLAILRFFRLAPQPRTEREHALLCPGRNFRYGRDIGVQVMMNLVMVLGYAVVSPLIVPFGILYVALLYPVWRYQVLYVYQRQYESGGLMWPFVAHKTVGCLALMVAFTGLVFIVKRAFTQVALLWVTLPLFLLWFDGYLTRRYDTVVAQVPLWAVHNSGRAHVDPVMYTPPPLRPRAEGWHPEWGKCWQHWMIPRYTV